MTRSLSQWVLSSLAAVTWTLWPCLLAAETASLPVTGSKIDAANAFEPDAIEFRVCQVKVDENDRWDLTEWLFGAPDHYMVVEGLFNGTVRRQRVVDFSAVKDGSVVIGKNNSVSVTYDRRDGQLLSADFSVAYFKKGDAFEALKKNFASGAPAAMTLLGVNPQAFLGSLAIQGAPPHFLDDALALAHDKRLFSFHSLTFTKTSGHFTMAWGWALPHQKNEYVNVAVIANLVGGQQKVGLVSCNDAKQDRELKRTIDKMFKAPVP